MAGLYWGHEYDATATEVLYDAADAGITTAMETLRARDARAILKHAYKLVKRQMDKGNESPVFADAMAKQVGAAVDQMNMRDANAGFYAHQEVVHAFRSGGTASIMRVVVRHGEFAGNLSEVTDSTIESYRRKLAHNKSKLAA